MNLIDKNLYDALITAEVGEELAAKAASVDSQLKKDTKAINAQTLIVERLQWVVLGSAMIQLVARFLG